MKLKKMRTIFFILSIFILIISILYVIIKRISICQNFAIYIVIISSLALVASYLLRKKR